MNKMYNTATKKNGFKPFNVKRLTLNVLNAVAKKLPVLLFLMGALLVGGKSWATTYTGTLGSTSQLFNTTPQTIALSSVNWTLTSTFSSSAYYSYDGSSSRGQQIGSAAKPATALTFSTSGLSGTISSVQVYTSGASGTSATVAVTVGGSAFGGVAQSIGTTSANNNTFTGTASGVISINWNNNGGSYAIYILKVVVIYTTPTINGAATATAFTTTYGTASAAQSFSISGSNLTANLVATPPNGYEVSSDGVSYGSSATFTQSSGSPAVLLEFG